MGKLEKVERFLDQLKEGGISRGRQGNFPEELQGSQGPFLILDRVERFCRSMEKGGGGGGKSAWEYEENFVEVFSRLLLIKNIQDKVEQFCRPMERRGGGGLYGSLYANCGCKISCEKLTMIPDLLAVFFFSF